MLHRSTPALFLAALCLSFAGGVRADAPDTAAQAAAALQAGRWPEAISLYSSLVQRSPTANDWRGLGRAYIGAGRYAEARDALQQALAADPGLMSAQFSMAIVQDHFGDEDAAFRYLDQAAAQGLPVPVLQTNPALAHMRSDGRFAATLTLADRVSHPCLYDPRYRAFDFWVGEWDVYASGAKVAHNSITRELSGCVIHEHWTDSSHTESYNYYDPESGQWHENLVDDSGRVARYAGGPLKDGGMQMQGASISADGSKSLARATWTPLPGGGLRHLVEHSDDGGKTWTMYFDGNYIKAAPALSP